MSQVLSFLFSLESDKALTELCRLLLIRIFLCFPSHHPGTFTIHPVLSVPSQITLLLGSSVALSHLFRLMGEKREKNERRQGREIYHISFGSPGTFCLWFVMFPCLEGALGRGSGLPPQSIPPGSLAARSSANSRWHPAPEGLPRLFGSLLNKLQP